MSYVFQLQLLSFNTVSKPFIVVFLMEQLYLVVIKKKTSNEE